MLDVGVVAALVGDEDTGRRARDELCAVAHGQQPRENTRPNRRRTHPDPRQRTAAAHSPLDRHHHPGKLVRGGDEVGEQRWLGGGAHRYRISRPTLCRLNDVGTSNQRFAKAHRMQRVGHMCCTGQRRTAPLDRKDFVGGTVARFDDHLVEQAVHRGGGMPSRPALHIQKDRCLERARRGEPCPGVDCSPAAGHQVLDIRPADCRQPSGQTDEVTLQARIDSPSDAFGQACRRREYPQQTRT